MNPGSQPPHEVALRYVVVPRSRRRENAISAYSAASYFNALQRSVLLQCSKASALQSVRAVCSSDAGKACARWPSSCRGDKDEKRSRSGRSNERRRSVGSIRPRQTKQTNRTLSSTVRKGSSWCAYLPCGYLPIYWTCTQYGTTSRNGSSIEQLL